MRSPCVLGRRAFDRLPHRATVPCQRRSHHRSVLRVQPHRPVDIARVLTDHPRHLLGRGPSGDALGGGIDLIRVDRLQRRHPGDGSMVSGPECFGRVIERRRQQARQSIDELVIQAVGRIDGQTRRGAGFPFLEW